MTRIVYNKKRIDVYIENIETDYVLNCLLINCSYSNLMFRKFSLHILEI